MKLSPMTTPTQSEREARVLQRLFWVQCYSVGLFEEFKLYVKQDQLIEMQKQRY